jgi:hypothetical protein
VPESTSQRAEAYAASHPVVRVSDQFADQLAWLPRKVLGHGGWTGRHRTQSAAARGQATLCRRCNRAHTSTTSSTPRSSSPEIARALHGMMQGHPAPDDAGIIWTT